MAYGITLEGFVIKDLQTIKSELEVDFKNSYGNDLDVSEDSVTGQLIGNLSKKFSNMWELAQAIYESFNPDNSEGKSLDGVAAMVGVERLSATSSNVTIALYGTLGTVIPISHLIRQTETNEDFSLETAVTLSLSSLIDADISVLNVLNSTLYTITINGNAYTYTSDGTATQEEIIAGLKVSVDLGGESIVFTDNLDGTANIQSDDGIEDFSLSVDVNLQIDTLASPGNYLAINTGALTVPANTITVIVNPISGLDSVNNIAAGFSGREVETDEKLRIRRRELLTAIGAATDEAIRAALLQDVDGVTSVLVVSNRTDAVDGDGRPAHSFEAIVSGGDNQEIANKIWEKQPSGIQSYGGESETVVDSTGNNQTVNFSRPTNVYVWLDIDYSLNTEESFPSDGEDLIKEAIVEYATTYIEIGDDVIYQRLSIPIYSIPGISTIYVELAVSATALGPPGAYSNANITIASNELAIFNEDRIALTLV